MWTCTNQSETSESWRSDNRVGSGRRDAGTQGRRDGGTGGRRDDGCVDGMEIAAKAGGCLRGRGDVEVRFERG